MTIDKPSATVNVFGKWQEAGKQFFNAWEFIERPLPEIKSVNQETKEYIYFQITK